jgi:F-box protein 18 (helicase)
MNLTQEQKTILDNVGSLVAGAIMHVLAFAGAGKTFILTQLAQLWLDQNQGKKGLYFAFNRSIAQEAGQKMPAGITSKTSHAIAYQVCGLRYRHKLLPKTNNQRLSDFINDDRNLFSRFGGSRNYSFKIGKLTQKTVNNFLHSEDFEMTLQHVPFNLARVAGLETEDMEDHEILDLRTRILEAGQKMWKAMCNVDVASVKMTPDGYLKLFHLERHQLGMDLIMFDEAQDANGANIGILKNQKNCAIVMVGDLHQAIYQFRGNVNAFEYMPATEGLTFKVSESFRFGPAVANVATGILGFKGEATPVKGFKEGDSVVEYIPAGEKHAFISRTNSGVFTGALNAISKGLKVHVVGGGDSLKFPEIEDVLRLSEGTWSGIKDDYVRSFNERGYDAFKAEVERIEDRDYMRVIKMIDEHGSDLWGMMKAVSENRVKMADADVVLCTGHKSKGLEWENVVLGDDFAQVDLENGKIPSEADLNLLYVVATRAEKRLVLNSSILALLKG